MNYAGNDVVLAKKILDKAVAALGQVKKKMGDLETTEKESGAEKKAGADISAGEGLTKGDMGGGEGGGE